MAFSDRQMYAVEITERVCSVFSLLGTAFIITTFLSDRSFHKPINRLVFFAAWGNIMSSVATLISTSGIHLGSNSSLCHFQAFLIQWYALPTPKIEGIRCNWSTTGFWSLTRCGPSPWRVMFTSHSSANTTHNNSVRSSGNISSSATAYRSFRPSSFSL